MKNIYTLKKDNGPIITAAIHAGHDVRTEIEPLLALSNAERLREEDPHTDVFADVSGTKIIGTKSRFEVDLNRPHEKAVYIKPEDAWGLKVWHSGLNEEHIKTSLDEYDLFYREIRQLLDEKLTKHKSCILLDIHSYNHRRDGANAPAADPHLNPDINIGTGTMHDRNQWTGVIDRCMDSLSSYKIMGNHLDVRENIKFKGGYFPKWVHDNYSESVCCISIEFKKFFMDEWSGEVDKACIKEIKKMLQKTIQILVDKEINE